MLAAVANYNLQTIAEYDSESDLDDLHTIAELIAIFPSSPMLIPYTNGLSAEAVSTLRR